MRAAAALLVLLGLVAALWQPEAAAAHPLGNFTVNRYSRIEIAPDTLRIRYVVDMAEIPTFQAMPLLDSNGDGAVTDAEKSAYAARTLAEVVRNVRLTLGARAMPLRVTSQDVEVVAGQAGLPTLRLSAWLEAPGAAAALADAGAAGARLEYRDDNEPNRIGWREVLVRAADGVAVQALDGSLPAQDRTDELRTYPEDLLMSPLDVRQVRLAAALGSAPAMAGSAGVAARPQASQTEAITRSNDGFAELLARVAAGALTPSMILVALLTAMALGGMHAMSPGHGKTIVGAYLAGSRGTARHALFLGLTVTVVHTAGVFALGLLTLYASRYVVPERVYPWMSLVSGLLVLGVGLTLIRTRVRALRLGHNTHSHRHSHGFGSHTHVAPGADGERVTWRSLLALGISGGLLPCPSALVVMLGAIALHQVAFGLLLIVAFSAGLAGSLTAIGLLMVYSGRLAGRLNLLERLGATGGSRAARLVGILPAVSAGVVTLAGLALSAEAARHVDLPAMWAESPQVGAFTPLALALAVGGAAVLMALRQGAGGRQVAILAPAMDDGPSRLAPVHGHGHDHGHDHNEPGHGDDGHIHGHTGHIHGHTGHIHGHTQAHSHSHAGHTHTGRLNTGHVRHRGQAAWNSHR